MTRFHVVCTLAVVSLANLTVAQAPSAQTQATTADVAVSSDAVEADEQPAVQRVAPTVVQNNCAEHALSTAMLSVVRVVSGQSHGSGVFVAPQLIVTALSVVERGHSIEVVDADGARHAAHISALDRSRGLALISVEAEGTPLPRANVVLGQRAVVLSAESSCSRDAHAQPVVQETVISSVRTDALGLGSLNHADIAGSAIVSCTGELLGIVARTGHGHGASFHGVPAVRAFDLIESRDRDRGYAGSFSGTIGLAAQMQFENNTRELMGLSLSMGVIGYDWAMLLARGAYLKAGESPGGTIAHREFERFRLDPILAGRIYVNVN